MREPKRDMTDDGRILISKDEYREYTELKIGQDRSIGTIRAQMMLQDHIHTKEKIEFARSVKKLADTAGLDNLIALVGGLAQEVYDRANEILATE